MSASFANAQGWPNGVARIELNNIVPDDSSRGIDYADSSSIEDESTV
jgi:hypothetical protein